MSNKLTKEQIEDLIIYCGSAPTRWREDDMLINCPVHGESNPSCGVSYDKQIFHCFSCGASGDFAWLLFKSLPDEFKSYKDARKFLQDRYGLEVKELDSKVRSIKRYEEQVIKPQEVQESIPMYKIAPYMSGKETYNYFFKRGFTTEDMELFKIGRDLENKTVTIPVFNEDGTLAGVIGRYISKHRKHNERYKIYDGFKRGNLLYPLNLLHVMDDTIIIVEGSFDAIKMHSIGYNNTLAIMTNELTYKQANWLCEHCSTVIYLGDNDKRGKEGMEKSIKLLKKDVNVLVVDYPEEGKDPCDWSELEIDEMIANAHSPFNRRIKRL